MVDELLLFGYLFYSLLNNISVGSALEIFGWTFTHGWACRNLVLRQLAVELRTVLISMVDGPRNLDDFIDELCWRPTLLLLLLWKLHLYVILHPNGFVEVAGHVTARTFLGGVRRDLI